jgi:iron-sulfur cluster assembly accessory protein
MTSLIFRQARRIPALPLPLIPRANPIHIRFIQQQASSRSPTLGPLANDATKLTNPYKTEKGETLRVRVSDNAAFKLNSIKESDNNPDLVLRVRVESGGCHGFQYIFSLKNSDTIEQRNDSIFERDGAKIIVDFTSLEILRDSTIDYTTELIGSQFKVVDSPYETSSCGCGSSFSFDPSKLNN